MKKIMLLTMVALLMAACATLTPEEKAAREAERLENLRTAVINQRYKISITSMKPIRGTSRSVSGGHWIKVDSTSLDCSLPYAGLDDVPHMKSRAEVKMDSKLDFRSDIQDYILQLHPNDKSATITFKADFHGLEQKFRIIIDAGGNAKIHLEPEGRDMIDYEGRVN